MRRGKGRKSYQRVPVQSIESQRWAGEGKTFQKPWLLVFFSVDLHSGVDLQANLQRGERRREPEGSPHKHSQWKPQLANYCKPSPLTERPCLLVYLTAYTCAALVFFHIKWSCSFSWQNMILDVFKPPHLDLFYCCQDLDVWFTVLWTGRYTLN